MTAAAAAITEVRKEDREDTRKGRDSMRESQGDIYQGE